MERLEGSTHRCLWYIFLVSDHPRIIVESGLTPAIPSRKALSECLHHFFDLGLEFLAQLSLLVDLC